MAHASKPAPSPTSRMQPRVHGAFPQVMTMVFRAGGGCGIRTREGLHPTRFPSERHRPLGESSGRKVTGKAKYRRTGRQRVHRE
jgi:hypothetical protein